MATRWYQERRREGYYRMAKREGYRARSAYKLQQVNEKYGVLREGHAVADLGCAPGGWSQVLVEIVGPEGVVVGVDLQRMKPIAGARFIQGDFMQRATHDRLSALLASTGRHRLDAVVSDMAPDMSGAYELDQVRSVQLAGMALDFAQRHLKEGGSFVCKVFEGADFQEFRSHVRAQFRSVYQFHPPASRRSSSEIYLIAKGFKGRPGGDLRADGASQEIVEQTEHEEGPSEAADVDGAADATQVADADADPSHATAPTVGDDERPDDKQ